MFDINKIRKDFPMIVNNQNMIYFDSSATSFKPQIVIDELNNFYNHLNSNIHRSDYDLAFNLSKKYDAVRDIVKNFINASKSSEIVFTSGATLSLNTVAYGLVNNYLKPGDTILTTYLEHASNLLPWFNLCKKNKINIKYIPLNEDGTFNLDLYKKCFEDKSIKLVSLTYVSNVLSYINPIKEISKIAHEHNALVNIDAAQAVGHFNVDVRDLDVDFLSFSAHKMLGPDGLGVLYGKKELLDNLTPLIFGGGSNARFDKEMNYSLLETPYKFESGTQNISAVISYASAISYINNVGINNIQEYVKELSNYCLKKLKELDNIIIYNPMSECGTFAINVKDIFSQDVASYLNKNNICVRSGNNCAKLLHNVIHTDDVVRISLFFYNTKEEIDKLISLLKDISIEKCIEAVI